MRRLLATLALLLGAPALGHCVYLDGGGIGQALIYPYYTTQNKAGSAPFNTFISVTNTRDEAKVVRVRLREGRNGREVLGLNLYLAPNDVWTAAVIPAAANDASGALVVSNDASCTNPVVPPPGLPLSTAAFFGANADGLGDDLARVREGYVEMIEMGTLTGASAASATRSATGFFPSCAGLAGASVALETAAPTGGLMGTLTVLNVNTGEDFTVNADALARLTTRAFYRNYDDAYPDFNAAEVDPVSALILGGKTYRMQWPTGLQAVESALMRAGPSNEVILDTATRSATDWVVTFPTKRFYDPANPVQPFGDVLSDGRRDITFIASFRPRDGEGSIFVDTCGSPCPQGTGAGFDLRMRFASSVVTFRPPNSDRRERGSATVSDALGSRNAWVAPVPPGTQSGAETLTLVGLFRPGTLQPLTAQAIRHGDGVFINETPRLSGFPIVGFGVRTFNNGLLDCGGASCQGNYGGSFPHKWITRTAPF